MANLKHEMRRLFDTQYFGNNILNEGLEDGMLEKIINFSILNSSLFEAQPWSIIAVTSLKSKYKLCNIMKHYSSLINRSTPVIILNEKKFFNLKLRVFNELYTYQCVSSLDENYIKDKNVLLALSLNYAAKYFGVKCKELKKFDKSEVSNAFSINPDMNISMILCMGYFNDSLDYSFSKRESYLNIVTEI